MIDKNIRIKSIRSDIDNIQYMFRKTVELDYMNEDKLLELELLIAKLYKFCFANQNFISKNDNEKKE
jgi:hypothetical protein